MTPRSTVTLLAALSVLLAFPAGGHAAKTNIAVGIGDQSPDMFTNTNFKVLKIKKVRYFLPWDAVDRPDAILKADAWLRAAKTANIRPLFHLDGLLTEEGKPPSVATYKKKARALVKLYRRGTDGRASVPEWGVWNEANNGHQPVSKYPGRTAKYFLALRDVCRGCTIVAMDLLDAGNFKGWIRSFYRALGRKKGLAKIVGIHNYGDTNRPKNNTGVIIKEVRRFNPRAQFWLTETGGITLLQGEKNGKLVHSRGLGCNPAKPAAAEKRQARAVAKMFRIARKFKRYVKRLYPYNFYATDCDQTLRFDAGLIRRDGSRRPAYNTLRSAMRNFRR